jgi:L-asparaginase/Glu-tRNA(Gln) amidotransferase subunit D
MFPLKNAPHAQSAAAMTKPRIVVITLGATIAMTPDQAVGGIVPSLSAG